MDLNGYFDPVSLDRPEISYLGHGDSFSHHIAVHTPDQPIRELDRFQVALFGVPEDGNGVVRGSADAPGAVREQLYRLSRINREINIYDLGNIKTGGAVSDTCFALRDVLLELRERAIISLILGGSQDLGRGVLMALEKEEGIQQVLTVGSMLDFATSTGTLNSRNYLDQWLEPALGKRISIASLGHQVCFTSGTQLEYLERSCLESVRLGVARGDLQKTEPLIRDARFITIDLGAVRQSEAPAASIPSPNGFFGDELCQITRYAGLSERVETIGFFEWAPSRDPHGQTAHLTAQAAWYFLDGVAHRLRENPVDTPEHIKKFIVNLNAAGHDIVFHKSTLSERWWMEVPVKNPATGHNFFVSCAYEDYQQACNQEIPDRWWRFLNRLGNDSE